MTSSGVDRFAELGPGSVLSGLNRRNARGIPSVPLGRPGDMETIEGWAGKP
jgi:malonyl CoA-acyl carrier protein transacylase